VARTGADELMISTGLGNHEQRRRSYELIAEEYDIRPLELVNGAREQQYPI
jgi:hypothetical protein